MRHPSDGEACVTSVPSLLMKKREALCFHSVLQGGSTGCLLSLHRQPQAVCTALLNWDHRLPRSVLGKGAPPSLPIPFRQDLPLALLGLRFLLSISILLPQSCKLKNTFQRDLFGISF